MNTLSIDHNKVQNIVIAELERQGFSVLQLEIHLTAGFDFSAPGFLVVFCKALMDGVLLEPRVDTAMIETFIRNDLRRSGYVFRDEMLLQSCSSTDEFQFVVYDVRDGEQGVDESTAATTHLILSRMIVDQRQVLDFVASKLQKQGIEVSQLEILYAASHDLSEQGFLTVFLSVLMSFSEVLFSSYQKSYSADYQNLGNKWVSLRIFLDRFSEVMFTGVTRCT